MIEVACYPTMRAGLEVASEKGRRKEKFAIKAASEVASEKRRLVLRTHQPIRYDRQTRPGPTPERLNHLEPAVGKRVHPTISYALLPSSTHSCSELPYTRCTQLVIKILEMLQGKKRRSDGCIVANIKIPRENNISFRWGAREFSMPPAAFDFIFCLNFFK